MSRTPEKEGWLRKRGSRMHRWSLRYFVLVGPKLSYKIAPEQTSIKGTFDLTPGCIVTEVTEDIRGVMKERKLFVFWIVWPQERNGAERFETYEKKSTNDSEHEEPDHKIEVNSVAQNQGPKHKDLKHIVESEMLTYKREKESVDEQLEKHHAHDKNVSTGMKVAAVAVGGVVVGALTAGIGLVPYIAVVGAAAVAGAGGVAYGISKPSDSRLILSCETMAEALSWKSAIEFQIKKLELLRKPLLPSSADPLTISHMLGLVEGGGDGAKWRVKGHLEGARLLDLATSPPLTHCRRAQVIVASTPLSAFLSLMEVPICQWPTPEEGSLKVISEIDDHADLLSLTVHSPRFSWSAAETLADWNGKLKYATSWRTSLTRFWRLDDDGVYLIACTSTPTVERSQQLEKGCGDLGLMLVMTIAPRKDHSQFDDDLKEALVTCSVQVEERCQAHRYRWSPTALDAFLTRMVTIVLDLKDTLVAGKYSPPAGEQDRDRDWAGGVQSGGSYDKRDGPTKSREGRPVEHRPRAASNVPPVAHGEYSPSGFTRKVPGGHNRSATSVSTVITSQPGHSPVGKSYRGFFRSSDGRGNRNKSSRDKLRMSGGGVGATASGDRSDSGASRSPSPVPAAEAVVPQTGSSKRSRARPGSRRRSVEVNSVVALLRDQIAAKDYAIQRLEKLIRRKGSRGAVSGSAGTRESIELLQQLQCMLLEIEELHKEYFALTNQDYDGRGRIRRVLSRITGTQGGGRTERGSGTNTPDSAKTSAVLKLLSSKEEDEDGALSGPEEAVAAVRFPSHWRDLRAGLKAALRERGLSHWEVEWASLRPEMRTSINVFLILLVYLTTYVLTVILLEPLFHDRSLFSWTSFARVQL